MATIHLPPDFKEFLRLLILNQVEYLLVGGYAVGYYGYPRATADLDIWIALHPQNGNKLVEVLKELLARQTDGEVKRPLEWLKVKLDDFASTNPSRH